MAWRKRTELFPAPLQEFREEDWPPVDGECLGGYTCHGLGYEVDCVPRPGEACGDRCYAMLARDYPDRPEVLAAARRADAFTRFHEARLGWLGEDRDGYVDEMIAGWGAHDKIRYAPFRERSEHG